MNPTTTNTTTTTTTTAAATTNITAMFNNLDVEIGSGSVTRVPTHIEQPSEAKTIVARNLQGGNQPVDLANTSFDPFHGVSRISSVTIGSFLGDGAFGQVYKGNWGDKLVALKKIDVNYAAGNLKITEEEVFESLQWEVSRLSTVSHPNLVQFYGIYQDPKDGCIYLVMEFCEGGTLQSKLEKDNVPYSVRWQWALELAEGLAYLHDQGILHRDLKAENVLLDKNGRAKLADLGVAQVDALVQSTEAHVVAKGMHDLHFIAPENFTVEGQPDNRRISTKATDIYALGLVFWQIASKGEIPRKERELSFEERTYLYEGQQIEKERIPDDCPKAFRRLILACWKREPSERPSAQDLVGRLEGLGAEFNPQHHVLIKACNQLEKIIHPKRKEALAYIAPFITARQVEEPIENYWDRWETSKENKDGPNPPLKLEDAFLKFIQASDCSTLLLMGEGGLGKTLTTYLWADQLIQQWWAYIKDPSIEKPSYFPIFIRPTVSGWAHTDLQGSFLNILKQYGLKDIPMLVFVDSYDELQLEEKQAPGNLVKHLGLLEYPKAKLIVTCRPNTVKPENLQGRFNFNGELQAYHFLPFSINQLLGYLKEQLSWEDETKEDYRRTLQSSKSVREVLRNPFVLYLLKQSWKTLSQEPLNQLNRWRIYEGSVRHSITIQRSLLSLQLQDALATHFLTVDFNLNVDRRFQAFASEIAFRALQNNGITFNRQEALRKLKSPWVKLKELVTKDARELFAKRLDELSKASEKEKLQKQRRTLLSEEDFVLMMQKRCQQFEIDLPLKVRGGEYEFSHKSFFEYFLAKKLLEVRLDETDLIFEKDLSSLMEELIESDPEVLLFLDEGWKETEGKDLAASSRIVKRISEQVVNDDNVDEALINTAINIAMLFKAIGRVLYARAKYAEALEYFLKDSAIKEQVLGKDHPDVATPYISIGSTLQAQGKYAEAMEYHLKALAIKEKAYGKDHSNVAICYNNIGSTLQAQGKNAEAMEYLLKALAIEEKEKNHPNVGISLYTQSKDAKVLEHFPNASVTEVGLGKEHLDVATSYNNIGMALQAQGKNAEAMEYLLKALAIKEQKLGKDHPDVATFYSNIGMGLQAQGKYAEAMEYSIRALAIKEQELGEDHPDVAISYNNIGFILQAQGKYVEAIEYYFKALTILEKVHGMDHPKVATCYNNIGEALQAQGKNAEALKYFLKDLAILEKVFGKDNADVGSSYNNIGLILKVQGKHTEALEYLLKALAIAEKAFGKDHQNVAGSYSNIGGVLLAQGNYPGAMEYFLKAEQVYGSDRPDVAIRYYKIGSALQAQGKYPEALEYHFKALAIREKVLGKGHSDVATSYNHIGLIFEKQIKYSEALEYYLKAVAIVEEMNGKDHPAVAICYNNIGGIFYKQSKYKEALECYFKALAIREKVYGYNHSNVALCYNNIGEALQAQGKYEEALEYLLKELAIIEKMFGKENPNVAKAYNNIGELLRAQAKYAEALEYCLISLTIRKNGYGTGHPDIAESYRSIGSILKAQNNNEEAMQCFCEALMIYEEVYGKEHPDTVSCMEDIKSLEQPIIQYKHDQLSPSNPQQATLTQSVPDSSWNEGMKASHILQFENRDQAIESNEKVPLLQSESQPKEKECLDNCCVIL